MRGCKLFFHPPAILRYIIFVSFKHKKLRQIVYQDKFYKYLFVNEKFILGIRGKFFLCLKIYFMGIKSFFLMVGFMLNLL